MKEIRRTDVFLKWFKKLKDRTGKFLIASRITRLREDNPGDARPLGEGVTEIRIHHGPGYRVYYKDTGKQIIILLCGGDKSTQQRDIESAKRLAREPEEEEDESK
ncbi:MAG: type II toxin-antitoxin system RelE/ParE family toxin [Treponema sp.]|jgi:putative addiction module killer protein|nr:type II toxin-antitoxin system RelE/ParE family toxin [Treponema sp.]